ncbi:MAG: EamA family transporter [Acidobacteriota bacterium]|jgi:multidrug transporter EmrE-like cation transporter
MRSSPLHVWSAILFVATLAVMGEVMIAAGMRQLGDLDDLRSRRGLGGTIAAVLTNSRFVVGALCMALNFFSMLLALSIANLSLAGPAIAALTYVGNAVAARFFLREHVDRRRWLATLCVVLGVILLSR